MLFSRAHLRLFWHAKTAMNPMDQESAETNDLGLGNRSATPAVLPSERLLQPTPIVPDHELLRCIGRGSYGEVWLARNVLGELRAVKIVYRNRFEHDRPFEREFEGIQKFEPISRAHPS